MNIHDFHKLKRSVNRVGPEDLRTLVCELQTITPILGGGTSNRQVDEVDFIRVPGVRSQLRQWFRAVFAHRYDTTKELYEAERSLWGGMCDQKAKASCVCIQIELVTSKKEIEVDRGQLDYNVPGFYAMWPARGTKEDRPAPRIHEGVTFRLHLTYPDTRRDEVEKSLKAWILFGGYGSRTRRGCGSFMLLSLKNDSGEDLPLSDWLPSGKGFSAERLIPELRRLLGDDLFRPDARLNRDFGSLYGASCCVGLPGPKGKHKWIESIDWLGNFRQQPANYVGDPYFARAPGRQRNRPGRSRWPEPDKLRRISREPRGGWDHEPRHNDRIVWPRASFGLPINGRFAGRGEPRPFELQWKDKEGKEHSRLASPLILKAMPLDNGQFVPIALWLDRRYPDEGKICLAKKDSRVSRSEADFDELVAPEDTARFAPLAHGQNASSGQRMQEAFFHWLQHRNLAVEAIR
ncbi:MAG: type III-B CRISPR module RAMP protein Cmr1 [Deltaproteobacteria bacterium]|nr:type III-B CRISPR module RAMP protein Cmr1 [Deltaproteobacteria bacterium]